LNSAVDCDIGIKFI